MLVFDALLGDDPAVSEVEANENRKTGVKENGKKPQRERSSAAQDACGRAVLRRG